MFPVKKYLEVASEEKDPFKKYIDTPNFVALLGNISNKKILDVGCGNGEFCKVLSQNGASVTGVDGSEEMVLASQKTFPSGNFIQLDILNDLPPFPDNNFDIITAKMMLMNLAPLSKILVVVFKLLKVNGLFAIDIVHPFRPLLKNLVSKSSTRYSKNFNYFKELNGGIEFGDKKMAFYYRPLNMYINDILNQGFKLMKLNEYGVDKNLVEQFPELKDKLNLPVSLHLLCQK